MAELKYVDAVGITLDAEMKRDDTVFIIGEDVGLSGGVWGTNPGLHAKYGDQRCCDAPIAESAIIGAAVGAAITGLRPVAEIMYIDFITCAMDQVINQAAKLRLMSGNKLKIPMVIRCPEGCGTAEAAQHSQNLEAWFVHTPGIKVVAPSTVYDLIGMLKSAIRDDNPVLFIEHRLLYGISEDVPDEEFLVPLGKAAVRKEGADITLISYSYMAQKCVEIAEKLKGEVDVEVIDIRSLVPLDFDTIATSVKKTGKCLVAHQAVTTCGMGAEIVRRVVEDLFDYLDAPPRVIGTKSVPIPYSPKLEEACIPQTDDIIAAIREMVAE